MHVTKIENGKLLITHGEIIFFKKKLRDEKHIRQKNK